MKEIEKMKLLQVLLAGCQLVSGGTACQAEGQAVMWRGVVSEDNLI